MRIRKLQNQFYIVRHGRARNNKLNIVSCKLETQKQYGLNQKGKDTVTEEARNYKNFDLIYTSPFRRTQETASYFANKSNCDVVLDNRLKEFDVGDLDLKSYDIFRSIKNKNKDPDYVYKNGESFSNVFERLIDFINEIDSRHIHKKILIVTHGVPAEILVDWANDVPPRKWEKCIEKGKVFSLQT